MARRWQNFDGSSSLLLQIERFDLLAGPWCTPQKSQARLDARIIFEAAHIDPLGKAGPAKSRDECRQHRFECDAV